jgi:hypothetical protein
MIERATAGCSNLFREKEIRTKYEDASLFPFDAAASAPVGCRIGAAKTDHGLCAG